MKKIVLFLLVTFALLAVYIASNMTYAQQTIVPILQSLLANEPFKDQLSQLEFTYWGQTISVETRGYHHFIEFLIRKGTHFFGFGIIGVLFFLLYRKLKWRWPAIFAIATVFLIASMDELHQLTMNGRTGTFDDVKLDTAGAICLVLFVKLLFIPFSKNK